MWKREREREEGAMYRVEEGRKSFFCKNVKILLQQKAELLFGED